MYLGMPVDSLRSKSKKPIATIDFQARILARDVRCVDFCLEPNPRRYITYAIQFDASTAWAYFYVTMESI
jgi:hypothetical protein